MDRRNTNNNTQQPRQATPVSASQSFRRVPSIRQNQQQLQSRSNSFRRRSRGYSLVSSSGGTETVRARNMRMWRAAVQASICCMRLVMLAHRGLKESERTQVSNLVHRYMHDHGGPIDTEMKLVCFLRDLGYPFVVTENEKSSGGCSSNGKTPQELAGYRIGWPVRMCVLCQIIGRLKRAAVLETDVAENLVLFSQLAVFVPRKLTRSQSPGNRSSSSSSSDGIEEDTASSSSGSSSVARAFKNGGNKINNKNPQTSKTQQTMAANVTSRFPNLVNNSSFSTALALKNNAAATVLSPSDYNNNKSLEASTSTRAFAASPPLSDRTGSGSFRGDVAPVTNNSKQKQLTPQQQADVVKRVPATTFVKVIEQFGFPEEVIDRFRDRAHSHPWMTQTEIEKILSDPCDTQSNVTRLAALTQSASMAQINARRARGRIQDASAALMSVLWRRLQGPNSLNPAMTSFFGGDGMFGGNGGSNNGTNTVSSARRRMFGSPSNENVTMVDDGEGKSIPRYMLPVRMPVLSSPLNASNSNSDPANNNNNKSPPQTAATSPRSPALSPTFSDSRPDSPTGGIASAVVGFSSASNNNNNPMNDAAALASPKSNRNGTVNSPTANNNNNTKAPIDRDQWNKKMFDLFGDTTPPPRKTVAEFRFVELSTPRRHQQGSLADVQQGETVGFTSSETRWWLRGVTPTSNRSSSRHGSRPGTAGSRAADGSVVGAAFSPQRPQDLHRSQRPHHSSNRNLLRSGRNASDQSQQKQPQWHVGALPSSAALIPAVPPPLPQQKSKQQPQVTPRWAKVNPFENGRDWDDVAH